MKATTALIALALIAFAGVAMAQRQDEALDSLMLSSSLQPVNDPIPRLLQEALESASAKPGSYGGINATEAPPAPVAASPPAPQKSSSMQTVAGAASLVAVAAAAALLL